MRPFFSFMRLLRFTPGLCQLLIAGIAFWALAPGIGGGFLFDDYVNLSALGDYGGVRSWQTFCLYLTSALGDPVGRPLSLLSFLFDATTWPASPQPFLRTNILLHLLNGSLLALVLLRLGRSQKADPFHIELAAIFGASLWLLHPLFLSTTLYIVQREAMLPATFILLGFLAWLSGRRRLQNNEAIAGYACLIASAFASTAMATLCKANGVLLPLLLLVAETTILAASPLQNNVRFLRARRILIGLPVAGLILAAICMLPQSIESANANRPWSLAQRVLTEPRVLLDYIQLIAFPRPISRGVFHDDFPVSTDWLHPWSTVPALAVVVITIAGAWHFRRRWPICAFAILFFFAGQALESSVIPLELYFEHRNYLPSMMAFWPFALWLTRPGMTLKTVRIAGGILIIAGLTYDLHLGAQIWGQPERLAQAWATRNPDSPRAQAYVAQYEMATGASELAERRLLQALSSHADETQLAFNLVDAQCQLGGVTPETFAAAQHAIQHDANAAALDYSWLGAAVERARMGSCEGLDLRAISAMLQAARSNEHFANAPGRMQDFDHVEGLIDLANGDPEHALAAFDHALAALPQPAIAIEQAALLGNAGRPDLGLRHLDAYLLAHPLQVARFGFSPASLHRWLLDHYGYWQNEFTRMRDMLTREKSVAPGVS